LPRGFATRQGSSGAALRAARCSMREGKPKALGSFDLPKEPSAFGRLNKKHMRKIDFANNEYYHIYNRGVNKQDVFLDKKDYWKFFDNLRDFNNETFYEERLSAIGISKDKPKEPSAFDFKQLGSFLSQQKKVVDVISYSLNPNHWHLILRQLVEKGISNFMHKVGLSFTNYFNKKYKHSGHVFQGAFKAVHINKENYLLWLFGYVNGNIEIHNLGKASDYSWSSYQAIKKALGSFDLPKEPSAFGSSFGANVLSNLSVLSGLSDIVLPQFKSEKEFEEFVQMVIKESRTKKEMEKYLLESLRT